MSDTQLLMNKLEEMHRQMLEQEARHSRELAEVAISVEARTHRVLDEKLDTFGNVQRELRTDMNGLRADVNTLQQSEARGQARLTKIESDVQTIRMNPTTSSHLPSGRDIASDWADDTKHDTYAFDDIAGNVFVKPPNPESVSPESIAQTLGTDKPVLPLTRPYNNTRYGFRVIVGGRGRDGVLAVSSFLNAKGRIPGLKIQREKTKLTMQRQNRLTTINNAIKQVISSKPSLNGLKTHVANNSCNLFLSYSDRQAAMDYRNNEAPAFQYPVWEHIPYYPTALGGRGAFDYTSTQNLEPAQILAFIRATVPNLPTDVTESSAARTTGIRPRSPQDTPDNRNQRHRYNGREQDRNSGGPSNMDTRS